MSDHKVRVAGIGAYLPGEPVPGKDIDEYLGAIPGKKSSIYYDIIEQYAGIKYRHYSLEKNTGRLLDDSPAIAVKAAQKALERAGLKGSDPDLIITTTTTPPFLRGGLAKEIRLLLGNAGCATYDLWGACTGIQQAITLTTGAIRAGMFRTALLVGVELASTGWLAENYAVDKIESEDMLLRAAIGDGAGALVLMGSDDQDQEDCILYTKSGTEGNEPSLFHRQAGGSTLPVNPETFNKGLHHWRHDFSAMVKRGMPYLMKIIKRSLEESSISIDDLAFIVPAAANFKYYNKDDEFIKSLAPDDLALLQKIQNKIFTNFAEAGNIPSASIYVSMNQLYEEGKLKKGDLILLPSVEGATWGWGASLLRWQG